MSRLLHIAINDLRLIFRDPTLRILFGLPLILFGLIVFFLPSLAQQYPVLESYISIFIMFAVFENTQGFCIVMSMVWTEEKETQVDKVYGILPLSRRMLTLSRLLIPYSFTVLVNAVFLWVQPFFQLGGFAIISLAMIAGLLVPIYALGINAIVKNKIESMMYLKVMNVWVIVPIAIFFLPEAYRPFFGIFPTYWLFIGIDQLCQDLPAFFSLSIALLTLLLVFGISLHYFLKRHFK